MPERYAALPELLASAGALSSEEAATLRRINSYRSIVAR
jgi:uncharacterized protein YutE (UPF0331/DUF86 family)